MSTNHKTIEEKLSSCQTLIWNAGSEKIQSPLSEMGINASKIDKAKSIYNDAIAINEKYKAEALEAYEAENIYILERDECKDCFKTHRKILKLALHKNALLFNKAGLNKTLERKRVALINQAIECYLSILNEPRIIEKVAEYGFTKEKIELALKRFRNLQNLYTQFTAEHGEQQEIRVKRDDKINELEEACHEIKVIAQIVFKNNPQALEKLGIIIRS